MQITLPWRRGQQKPFGSIPRINRAHPLAQGLVIYYFDRGISAPIDLCNQNINFKQGGAASPLPVQSTKFGTGLKFPASGSAGWTYSPENVPIYQNFAATAPYTIATATFNTGAPTANANAAGFVTNTGAFDSGSIFYVGTSTRLDFSSANSFNASFTQAIATNVYQTWVGVVTDSTHVTLYANGAQDSTATGTVIGSLSSLGITGGLAISNSSCSNAQAFPNGVSGFLPYFACWNRALSAGEVRLLNDDPYCFLIYPEDEMFASMFAIPPTPGVITFRGGTLPMMGVG